MFGKQPGDDQNDEHPKTKMDTNEASGTNKGINLLGTLGFPFTTYPYFETTCPFNLHLIHTDDSNTLTAERVQGEPGEKTGRKHTMKVEHDNIRYNAQGTAGTNENLRDHADDHGILHHVGNFFGAIGRGVTNAASWMWEAIKSPFT